MWKYVLNITTFFYPKNLTIHQLSIHVCSLILQADPTTKASLNNVCEYTASSELTETMLVGDLIAEFSWSSPSKLYKYTWLKLSNLLDKYLVIYKEISLILNTLVNLRKLTLLTIPAQLNCILQFKIHCPYGTIHYTSNVNKSLVSYPNYFILRLIESQHLSFLQTWDPLRMVSQTDVAFFLLTLPSVFS